MTKDKEKLAVTKLRPMRVSVGFDGKCAAQNIVLLDRRVSRNPARVIVSVGSTKSRTRLYRLGISKYLSDVEIDFEIYGELKEGWENFNKNNDYDGFLAKRKK